MSKFDTHNVEYMTKMFSGCESFTNLDLSSLDTSNVKYMNEMFNGIALTSLDLSGFSTYGVMNMEKMFYSSSKLKYLNLLNFDTSHCINFDKIIEGIDIKTTVILSKNKQSKNEKLIKALGNTINIEYL